MGVLVEGFWSGDGGEHGGGGGTGYGPAMGEIGGGRRVW